MTRQRVANRRKREAAVLVVPGGPAITMQPVRGVCRNCRTVAVLARRGLCLSCFARERATAPGPLFLAAAIAFDPAR